MPIPDYQTLMIPLLKISSDGEEHKLGDAIDLLSKVFNLTDEERKELLPCGQQAIINNRAGWASTYLRKAHLLESSRRGYFKITNKGLEVLKNNPKQINRQFLLQFETFKNFINVNSSSQPENTNLSVQTQELFIDTNPEETIENLITDLQKQLAIDLLDKIKANSPSFFENLVADLLLKMGYGSSKKDIIQNTGKSGDEGIDGIIKEDVLGLDKIYIQAKRWKGTIGRPEIQKFAGALLGQNANKGIFITTSTFTNEAKIYAKGVNSNIVLIDGDKLTELMIRYNLGVQAKYFYEIKKIDEDFFYNEV